VESPQAFRRQVANVGMTDTIGAMPAAMAPYGL
jgi:hypothetical protein